jgi:hypothetical protein
VESGGDRPAGVSGGRDQNGLWLSGRSRLEPLMAFGQESSPKVFECRGGPVKEFQHIVRIRASRDGRRRRREIEGCIGNRAELRVEIIAFEETGQRLAGNFRQTLAGDEVWRVDHGQLRRDV